MREDVCWLLQMEVARDGGDALRTLMEEMAAATKANEPGTLAYEWSLSEDGNRCDLYERYAGSAAALTHLRTFNEKFSQRFTSLLKAKQVTLYGMPNDEVRAALEGFGATYLKPYGGFSR